MVARDQDGREAIATVRIVLGKGEAGAQPPVPAEGQRSGSIRDGKPLKLAEVRLGKVAFTQQLKMAARNAAIRFS